MIKGMVTSWSAITGIIIKKNIQVLKLTKNSIEKLNTENFRKLNQFLYF